MKVRPGPELVGRQYMKRFGLALAQASSSSAGRRLHAVGHVFEQRTGGVVVDDDAEAVTLDLVQSQSGGLVIRLDIGEFIGKIGQDLQPELLFEPGCEPVAAGQDEVEIRPPASCCALILLASSGAGAFTKAMRETSLGLAAR